MRIETIIDDDVWRQLRELADVHTGGNLASMLSILIRERAMGQEFEYARMREDHLQARLEKPE